jgi:hypothetical protein
VSSRVYSTRLIEQAGLTGNVGFTVPEGFTCVLRDVDCYVANYDTETGFYFAGAVGNILWRVVFPDSAESSQQWRGRQVFNPGDIITFAAQANPVDFAASGYLLELP